MNIKIYINNYVQKMMADACKRAERYAQVPHDEFEQNLEQIKKGLRNKREHPTMSPYGLRV